VANGELSVRQSVTEDCIVEKLPDGSTAVFNKVSNAVYSLDAGAAAAFEACREPASIPTLAAAMRERLGPGVTDETALEAVAELERAGLISSCGGIPEVRNTSRRQLLKAAGLAVPTVLALTAAEQRAFAQGAGSGGPPATIISATTDKSPNSVVANCGINTITITGQNTHFVQATSQIQFTPAATGYTIVVNSPTSMTVNNVAVPGSTPAGPLNFTITTGPEVVHGNGFLTVVLCS
jgi:hypothetical protein